MKKRHAPSPPTLIPIMFLGCCLIVTGVAWLLDSMTSYPWWFAIGLLPFLLALLPAEIKYIIRRRQICAHIKEDFVAEEIGVQADYGSLLAEIHGSNQSPRRQSRTNYLKTTGSSSWPTTEPTA